LRANFRRKGASPTNHCWCQKTQVIAFSCGIKISAVHCLVFVTKHACDGQTDGQNHDSQDRCGTAARAVKVILTKYSEERSTVSCAVRCRYRSCWCWVQSPGRSRRPAAALFQLLPPFADHPLQSARTCTSHAISLLHILCDPLHRKSHYALHFVRPSVRQSVYPSRRSDNSIMKGNRKFTYDHTASRGKFSSRYYFEVEVRSRSPLLPQLRTDEIAGTVAYRVGCWGHTSVCCHFCAVSSGTASNFHLGEL